MRNHCGATKTCVNEAQGDGGGLPDHKHHKKCFSSIHCHTKSSLLSAWPQKIVLQVDWVSQFDTNIEMYLNVIFLGAAVIVCSLIHHFNGAFLLFITGRVIAG